MKKVQFTQEEDIRLVQEIQTAPFTIPIRRTDVTVHTIPPGVRNITIERLTEGQLPRQIFVAFVNSQGYNGEQNKNPFLFSSYNVESITTLVNGIMVPTRPYFPR